MLLLHEVLHDIAFGMIHVLCFSVLPIMWDTVNMLQKSTKVNSCAGFEIRDNMDRTFKKETPLGIRHHQASSGIIRHHQASSGIIRHHQASSGIIRHHQASSGIIRHHQASSGIIRHHQASSDIIRHHQASSGIIRHHRHHQASSGIIRVILPCDQCNAPLLALDILVPPVAVA